MYAEVIFRRRSLEDHRYSGLCKVTSGQERWWTWQETNRVAASFSDDMVIPQIKGHKTVYSVKMISTTQWDSELLGNVETQLPTPSIAVTKSVTKPLLNLRINNEEFVESMQQLINRGLVDWVDAGKAMPSVEEELFSDRVGENDALARFGWIQTCWSPRLMSADSFDGREAKTVGEDSGASSDNSVDSMKWDYKLDEDVDWDVKIESRVAAHRPRPAKKGNRSKKRPIKDVTHEPLHPQEILAVVRPWFGTRITHVAEFILFGCYTNSLSSMIEVQSIDRVSNRPGYCAVLVTKDKRIEYHTSESSKKLVMRLYENTRRCAGWNDDEMGNRRFLYNDKMAAKQSLLMGVILDTSETHYKVNRRQWVAKIFVDPSTVLVPIFNGPTKGVPLFTLARRGKNSVHAVFLDDNQNTTIEVSFC